MSPQENRPLALGQINEHKVRVIAFLVLVAVSLYLLTGYVIIPAILVLDFGLRSFDLGKFSPFAHISEVLVRTLNLGVKPIYYPPKRFAARIGLGFSITILLLQSTGNNTLIISGVLAFFAALESLAGICAGCYVYNWLLPIWQKLRPGA